MKGRTKYNMPTKVNIEQEEQKILKEFEEKGWTISFHSKDHIRLIRNKKILDIYHNLECYQCWDCATGYSLSISIETHQLLHKLFELWGVI